MKPSELATISWFESLPARSTSTGLASPSPRVSTGKPRISSASRCRNSWRRSSPVMTGPGAPAALETTTRTVKAYGSVLGRPLEVCPVPPFSLPVKEVGSPCGKKICRTSEGAGVATGNLHNFIKNSKPADDCFLTNDFLEQGVTAAPVHLLSEFVGSDGKITKEPQDLVFRENTSTLIGPDGKPITSF